jgi:hypothetical protein
MPSETVYFPQGMYDRLQEKVQNGDAENFSKAVQQEIGNDE